MSIPSDTPWNPDTIASLRTLWADGHSASAIGRRLGVSKNAVIGKVRRLKMPARPTPIRRRDPNLPPATAPHQKVLALAKLPSMPIVVQAPADKLPKPAAAAVLETSKAPEKPLPALPALPTGRIRPCCWPIGEPGRREFRYCEQPSIPGKPYCLDHSRKAYIRPRGTEPAPLRSSASPTRGQA